MSDATVSVVDLSSPSTLPIAPTATPASGPPSAVATVGAMLINVSFQFAMMPPDAIRLLWQHHAIARIAIHLALPTVLVVRITCALDADRQPLQVADGVAAAARPGHDVIDVPVRARAGIGEGRGARVDPAKGVQHGGAAAGGVGGAGAGLDQVAGQHFGVRGVV